MLAGVVADGRSRGARSAAGRLVASRWLAWWVVGVRGVALGAVRAVGVAYGAIAPAKGGFAEAEARYRQALEAARSRGDRATAFEALGDLLHLYWTREELEALKLVVQEATA